MSLPQMTAEQREWLLMPIAADEPVDWQGESSLPANRPRVWLTDPEFPAHDCERYQAQLSDDERARCARLKVASARRQFVVARGFLRSVIAKQLGIAASQIGFRYGRYGKPELAEKHGGGLYFSLSHTRGLIAVALSSTPWVGIDAEHLDAVSAPNELAGLMLAASESRDYADLSEGRRTTWLLEIWTAKEAYLKALGCGLNWNLPDLLVCRASATTASVRPAEHNGSDPSVRRIRWLAVGPRHVVAVTV